MYIGNDSLASSRLSKSKHIVFVFLKKAVEMVFQVMLSWRACTLSYFALKDDRSGPAVWSKATRRLRHDEAFSGFDVAALGIT